MTDRPIVFDEDTPEWTEETFARARPGAEVLPPTLVAALLRNKGGRPRGSAKEQVTIRIDKDVLGRFRATGRGWQSRLNAALRKVAP